MISYTGKYTSANVYIDYIDAETEKQIISFVNDESFTDSISIMPDCHAGKGAVVGFTMPLPNRIIPNVIGVDIGCGMLSVNLGPDFTFKSEEFDKYIRSCIPFGTSVREKANKDLSVFFYNAVKFKIRKMTMELHKKFGFSYEMKEFNTKAFEALCERAEMDFGRALKSVGTLGGGNHFIEIGVDAKLNYWMTFHSGSRQLGQKTAVYHQRKAGKGDLAYLEGQSMYDYLVDMIVCQQYAAENRFKMHRSLFPNLGIHREAIESVHNYIDFNDFIIRKGAISSYEGEKMIIPFNMEDGILICEGKSNASWNFSAPHGAGRVGSRSWAKEALSKEIAAERMEKKGIYFSTLPVDETKLAYKDPEMIERAIRPTAKIVNRIKPVLNCKGD